MFIDRIVEDLYKDIAKSIIEKINKLKLTREMVLKDPKRVTEIRKYAELDENSENYKKFKLKYYESHPNFLGKTEEYNYLNDLYKYDDRDTFIKKSLLLYGTDELRKKRQNYDKILWGHIDWDGMFTYLISELSKLDTTTILGTLFEEALIDYIPYTKIKQDTYIWHSEYEIKQSRVDAINWVFLRHESENFKTFFLNHFKGKDLRDFHEELEKAIQKYLIKKKPKPTSLGFIVSLLQKNIYNIQAVLGSSDKYPYLECGTEFTKESKLLDNHYKKTSEYLGTLEKMQKELDDIFRNNETHEFKVSPKCLLDD